MHKPVLSLALLLLTACPSAALDAAEVERPGESAELPEGGSRRSFGLLERYQKTPTAPLFKNIVEKVLEQLSNSRSQREAEALEEPSQAS